MAWDVLSNANHWLGLCREIHICSRPSYKSEDMPRPDTRGRGRGRGQHVEAEVEDEDKTSASRTVWPRGLNITGYKVYVDIRQDSRARRRQ